MCQLVKNDPSKTELYVVKVVHVRDVTGNVNKAPDNDYGHRDNRSETVSGSTAADRADSQHF